MSIKIQPTFLPSSSALPNPSIDLCFGTRNPHVQDCPWFSLKVYPCDSSITWTNADKDQILSDLVTPTIKLGRKDLTVEYYRNNQWQTWNVQYVPK